MPIRGPKKLPKAERDEYLNRALTIKYAELADPKCRTVMICKVVLCGDKYRVLLVGDEGYEFTALYTLIEAMDSIRAGLEKERHEADAAGRPSTLQ